jgi:FkbM family methyltransferase
LSEGKIFVDLGANEGYFSILASKLVGKSGNVIAVEPQSRLIPILQKNIHINACDNVRIIRGLVSSRTGSKPIHLAPLTNTGSSSIYRPTKYALPVEIVPSFTLDGIFKLANLKRCDLLKIDVEGAEGEIINGARNNLRSMNIKMIVVEFHKEALAKAKWSQEDINEQIVRSGYRADPCGDFVVYRSFNSADC